MKGRSWIPHAQPRSCKFDTIHLWVYRPCEESRCTRIPGLVREYEVYRPYAHVVVYLLKEKKFRETMIGEFSFSKV